MPHFTYQGRDSYGKLVKGEQESNRAENLAEKLIAEGIVPIEIKELKTKPLLFSFISSLFTPKVKLADLLVFCHQMYSLVKAGIPILSALIRLQEITPNPLLKKALMGMQERVSMGDSLSNAMRHYPSIFSALVINLIAAGESNGRLDQAFGLATQHLELASSVKKKLKTVFRYPVLVLSVAAVAITVINIFVIPQFAKLYSSFHAALPLPTRILMGISSFMQHNGLYLLLALIAFAVWIRYLLAQKKFRFIWDRYQLKIPIIGSLIDRIIMANFSRTFSMLLESGVPLTQAVNLVSKVVNNSYAESKILQLSEKIEQGESLLQAATALSFFSPLVLQMLAVGEETGSTDKMLRDVATLYEEEVSFDIARLSARMEPVLLIILGVMVLVLALGVFLPMWNLATVVK